MNPSLPFWLQWLLAAALAALTVFGLAGALLPRLRSAGHQRAGWLAAFTALGLFLIAFQRAIG